MSREATSISESATVIKYNKEEGKSMSADKVKWMCNARLEKYNTQESYDNGTPDEVMQLPGNTALLTGLELMWKLVNGQGDDTTNYFLSSSNACIGVGNSNAAASSSQTGLLGTSKFYKEMDQATGVTYPLINANVMTFRSKFGADEANFSWNEWGILNGNPDDLGSREADTVIQFNRKVESMGTKVAGSTWVIVADITINP